METDIDLRARELGEYIIETGCTVRAAALKHGISTSTVHKDVSVRLRKSAPALYADVSKVLEKNRLERHIRGGAATRRKYLETKQLTKSIE